MRRPLPLLLPVIVALAYPLAVLAGGLPRFPSVHDCVHPAVEGQPVEAVFGYFESERDAAFNRARAERVGFQGTVVERDACGMVKVVIHGIPTVQVGHALVAEARRVGLRVTLEQER